MSLKRPYPESYQVVHHRSPRVAALLDGRIAVLPEPGFEVADHVRLHLCDSTRAREGLPGPGLLLVGPCSPARRGQVWRQACGAIVRAD